MLFSSLEYIPSAPRDVAAELVDDTVKVSWVVPEKNAKEVEHFDVFYSSAAVSQIEESVVSIIITCIVPGTCDLL